MHYLSNFYKNLSRSVLWLFHRQIIKGSKRQSANLMIELVFTTILLTPNSGSSESLFSWLLTHGLLCLSLHHPILAKNPAGIVYPGSLLSTSEKDSSYPTIPRWYSITSTYFQQESCQIGLARNPLWSLMFLLSNFPSSSPPPCSWVQIPTCSCLLITDLTSILRSLSLLAIVPE